jgi:uncharacterized protein (DUF1800 family)
MTDLQRISHLYWRAGFGLSPQQYRRYRAWPLDRVLDELLRPDVAVADELPDMPDLVSREASPEMRQQQREASRMAARQGMLKVNTDWLLRMATAETGILRERMTLFWHGHFACESRLPKLAVQQLNTIRQHALGNFRDLLVAISRDPAMIRYLNNQQNRKQQPNENFARELMELFTIGRGHYTEQDVKEAARAFTGWSSTLRGEFVFRSRQHDFGPKTFFGQTGNWNGEDVIDMILAKPETAVFLTRKIYRYFVSPAVDEARVQALAQTLYASDYDIGQLMVRIFRSEWFYDQNVIGSKVKSPVELLAGFIRQLQLSDVQPLALLGLERALGQVLFKPPNVAGWPGGLSWIDNSTLLLRLQLGSTILRATVPDFSLREEAEGPARQRLRKLEAQADLAALQALGTSAAALQPYLLQLPAQLDTRVATLDFATTLDYLLSLPEYQFC